MTQAQDANDLLMGGGIKAFSFDTLGDTILGTILDQPKAVQMTKYQSTELAYWPSGDPMMQVVVTVQTDLRDPSDPYDEGKRRLYIPPRMMTPVRQAILKSGAKGLQIGGQIAVRWVDGTGKGEGNPKVYAADYAPPAVDPAGLIPGAAPTAAPAVAQQPVTAPAVTQQPMLQQTATPAVAMQPTAAPAATQPLAAPAFGSQLPGPQKPPNVAQDMWDRLDDNQKAAVAAASAPTLTSNTPPF
jgi:hypothetical protein